jgi:hypothetical protein
MALIAGAISVPIALWPLAAGAGVTPDQKPSSTAPQTPPS